MSKLIEKVSELFGVTPDKVPGILWALDIRDICTRCKGSGHYSFTPRYGTKCFKCTGRGKIAAKLTKASFEEARVKVEAGKLEVIRTANRARLAAKKDIAPLITEAREVYITIADEYEAAYRSKSAGVGISEPLWLAQNMNNCIFYGQRHDGTGTFSNGVMDIELDVKAGRRRNYVRCVSELKELINHLKTLRDAWFNFERCDSDKARF